MGNGKATVTVRGNGLLKPPILVTDEAHLIEFRDSFGDLNALLFKVLNDECWALVTKGSDEWASALVRFGYIKPSGSIEDLIRTGIR